MTTDERSLSANTPRFCPRLADGEWNGDALAFAFLRSDAFEDLGPQLAETARVLTEIVASRDAVRRFTEEMGWSDEEQRSFASLRPPLLDSAETWLDHASRSLNRTRESSSPAIDVGLTAAFELANDGAPMAAVESALPEDSAKCRARAAFIRGEAAWRHDMIDRASQDFERFSALAPHITVGHRRLGQVALAKGYRRRAARHFEAAVAIPNQRWAYADQPDDEPILVGRIGQKFDIYRFRGGLYPVHRTPEFIGLAVVAGRLVQVYDTPVYRLWRRVKPRREIVDLMLSPGRRRRAKRLMRSLGRILASALLHAARRFPRAGELFRRVANLFLGGHGRKKELAPTGPGRLMSILLRLVRPFRRSPIGRIYRWLESIVISFRIRAIASSAVAITKLALLRFVFRAKELPPGVRAETVEDVIVRLGQPRVVPV